MFKLPDFPTLKFPAIDLPNFDLPKFEMPTFDFPTIDFPSIDFSKLDVTALRNVKLPNVRDAAYITVGLGVVAVERVQARREQLTAAVTERIEHVRELIRTSV
jgi:hypothetical protein